MEFGCEEKKEKCMPSRARVDDYQLTKIDHCIITNIDSCTVYYSVDYFVLDCLCGSMDALNYSGLEIKKFGVEKVWHYNPLKVWEPWCITPLFV